MITVRRSRTGRSLAYSAGSYAFRILTEAVYTSHDQKGRNIITTINDDGPSSTVAQHRPAFTSRTSRFHPQRSNHVDL